MAVRDEIKYIILTDKKLCKQRWSRDVRIPPHSSYSDLCASSWSRQIRLKRDQNGI